MLLDPKVAKEKGGLRVQLVNVGVMVFLDAQVSVDFRVSRVVLVLQVALELLVGKVPLDVLA